MLPSSYRQQYQEFLAALTDLLHTTKADHPEQAQLKEKFQKVQQGFQEQIARLSGDGLDPAVAPRWQSLQTEIHRQMRLLEMDLIFLQASRQSATAQTRQAAMNNRIKTLIGYCEGIMGLGTVSASIESPEDPPRRG